MISTLFFIATAALANTSSDKAGSQETKTKSAYAAESPANTTPYVFGWMDYSEPKVTLEVVEPSGMPVTLVEDASERWSDLQEEGLDAFERDKRAILAMTGDYRISFDFLEVELDGAKGELTKPYRSWATERVFAIDTPDDKISLQHIIVMFMELPRRFGIRTHAGQALASRLGV